MVSCCRMIPLGIRREKLAEYIGSEQIAREMIADGWLKPIVQDKGLTLFATSDIAKAFQRLKGGERPPRIKVFPSKNPKPRAKCAEKAREVSEKKHPSRVATIPSHEQVQNHPQSADVEAQNLQRQKQMKSPYITMQEVAAIERVHIDTAYGRARSGRIPGAKRVGGVWRINAVVYAKARGLNIEQLTSN